MHFLLTRPEPDCHILAQKLIALGHEVDLAPLLTISYYDTEPVSLTRFRAILFTSANGVRAFVRNSPERDIPCFTVGAASAHCATENGFQTVYAADGNVATLAELISRRLEPGPLLHISARDITGNLAAILQKANFTVTRKQLYQADPAPRLPARIETLITAGGISHIALYSPRSAKIFGDLIRAAAIDAALCRITALCLSPAVANMIDFLRWRDILTAPRPNQTSLFQLVKITFKENQQ